MALIVNPEENQLKPKAEISRDIRNEIVSLGFAQEPDKVRFFSTVNTPMDYHGIDALFIINGIPITLDASLDPDKIDRLKADIYIPGDFPLKEEDMDSYIDWIEEKGEKIFRKYEEKLSELTKGKLSAREKNNVKTIAKILKIDDITNLREIKEIAI